MDGEISTKSERKTESGCRLVSPGESPLDSSVTKVIQTKRTHVYKERR